MATNKHSLVTGVVLIGILATGCAWRDVSPKLASPPTARIAAAAAVLPVDDQTAMADLEAISKRLRDWGSADVVFFPYREGDTTDLFLNVRLRQSHDQHLLTNVLRGVAIGLTFGLLSPVLGVNFTEIHDVDLQIVRSGHVIGTHHFQMRTDLSMGLGGDSLASAKALDEEQMSRIAQKIVDVVVLDLAREQSSPNRLSMQFSISGCPNRSERRPTGC
jgi:hypothetical protein